MITASLFSLQLLFFFFYSKRTQQSKNILTFISIIQLNFMKKSRKLLNAIFLSQASINYE